MTVSMDLRDEIRAKLGWDFSYASSSPLEARCVIENPTEGKSPEISEWFVRSILTPPKHSETRNTNRDHFLSHTDVAAIAKGMDRMFEDELDLGSVWDASAIAVNQGSITEDRQLTSLEILERLYTDIPRYDRDATTADSSQWFRRQAVATSSHLSALRGIYRDDSSEVRTDGEKSALAVFEYEKYSLQDVLKYNRHVFHDDKASKGAELALSDMKKRFVLYQLYRALQFLHKQGLACNGFSPSDVLLTDTLWVRLGVLPIASYEQRQEENRSSLTLESRGIYRTIDSYSSRSITAKWCAGDLSNFEYLMILNTAAGRRMIDGVFHPFLPWVTDFTAPNSGWRDLTKSKFRLNKGDNQLDRTYDSSVVPHHVTESLSEITYYMYMARRTPMTLLRQIVRSNFQPKEYPSNMARMYDWTPDECIPEFYVDSTVFMSIHGDAMDDLQLPSWCQDAYEFIKMHRAMLESDEVSKYLHAWIDLNFGVGLSGEEAIRQKNVPLRVQGETRLGKSPGFVQLFDVPHPQRCNYTDTPIVDDAIQSNHDKMHTGIRQAPGTKYPGQMKTNVANMLTKALKIVNDSNDNVTTISNDQGADSLKTGTGHAPTANQSFGGTSEAIGQTINRFKQRKKAKSRTRFHISDPPLSPPSSKDVCGSRPQNVSRLATVIPNFFHPDLTSGAAGGNDNTDELALSFPADTDTAVPSSIVTLNVSHTQNDMFADGGASGDRVRHLSTTTPTHASTTGFNLPSHRRNRSFGSTVMSPGTHSSHLFRDFWQQLSKPDEEGSNLLGNGGGQHDTELEWNEEDDCLDEIDLQLLEISLPIAISMPNEHQSVSTMTKTAGSRSQQQICQSKNVEIRAKLQDFAEAVVDPAYALPEPLLLKCIPDVQSMPAAELAKAADLFSLGCIIAELYTHTPLFSQRSIVEYLSAYTTSITQPRFSDLLSTNLGDILTSVQPQWNTDVARKLTTLPVNMKSAVLALIHPNPRKRLLISGILNGKDISEMLLTLRNNQSQHDILLNTKNVLGEEFCPSQSNFFPPEFATLYRFLAQFHRTNKWDDQFETAKTFLPSLAKLPLQQFRVVLPVLTRFFQPPSHTTSIAVEKVTMAVVFLLPMMAQQLGTMGMRFELMQNVLRVYESSDLAFVLKICLSSPVVLQQMIRSFGSANFLEHFLPVLVDWLGSVPAVSGPAFSEPSRFTTKMPLFAAESCSITAVAFGELSSSSMLGPSLAAKYILPALLPNLGKIKAKWTKLSESSPLIRMSSAANAGIPRSLGGKNNDGIHVTFMSKTALYEPHYIADAILVVCREVEEHPICDALLPHLFDVLPRLVTLAEKIGSVRIEGVPEDLGREIYVILRILRHIIRTLSDTCIQREFLQRKPETLADLLLALDPPFLHPRTAAAIINAATASSKASDSKAAAKKRVLRSMSFMKKENHQDLRAFLVVGLARTIVSMCQKLGPDATMGAVSVVQAINQFLGRCSVAYGELEVSNFQWHFASEIVTEFCVPLRNLLGRELFDKHFPIVQNSTVLQLLLLPMANADSSNQSNNVLMNRTSLSSSLIVSDRKGNRAESKILDPSLMDRTVKQEAAQVLANYPKELLRFAYQTVRLNSVKSTSFLHVPAIITNYQQQELNDEMLAVQEERRKRKASTVVGMQRYVGDYAWLRPHVKTPFTPKVVVPDTSNVVGWDPASAMRMLTPPSPSLSSGNNEGGLGSSWAFTGEIKTSIKAHSSSVRSICVDYDEEILISGSKNGSCRVWRLASHPCQSQPVVYTDAPILAVQNAMDGVHAMAVEASCVHVWDIRTSQVRFKLPFQGESVYSMSLLRALPFHFPLLNNSTSYSSALPSSLLSNADFAVATSRKVVTVDLRIDPRVAAEWRIDMRDGGASITTIATVFSLTSGLAYVAVATANGVMVLLDKRTGRQITKWAAIEGKINKIVQFGPSLVLVVGSEREARVWDLREITIPRLRMIISGIPEGIREAQVTVQSSSSGAASVLYIANNGKLFATRLVTERDCANETATVVHARVDVWYFMEPTSSNSAKIGKSKLVSHSLGVLPLRQLLLVGTEDGLIKCAI